jgi:2,3-bisphosphoglycerate-dependent phosphoglycerate mutase
VMIWRRSFDIPPPPLEATDPRHPKNDKRYHDLKPEELPLTEVLLTLPRVSRPPSIG